MHLVALARHARNFEFQTAQQKRNSILCALWFCSAQRELMRKHRLNCDNLVVIDVVI